eukprot:NODE_2237_length_1106_cov_80.357508_g2219_i0.p1 GENE.NODE_2237_length_1106_cov_80.357508_g2219_i0~~NODE_2237_length_1106_cov_80.357508_g2219_i0.p1  ORF type:complete len:279 (-),score=52.11 NODE_2237_length_1106_cov_80.357508_g2219_i0:186-1022(-)
MATEPPPQWKDDHAEAACEACRQPWSFFARRRHHCRNCGGLFCDGCSSSRVAIPKYGYNDPVRVCGSCMQSLGGTTEDAPSQPAAGDHPRQRGPSFVRQRKVCILGAASVGKSAVTQQFVEDKFVTAYNPTINHTFYKKMKVRGEDFLLSVLDTAGQDECSIFQPQYSIGTHGYIVVYSITDRGSFELCKQIYEKIEWFAVEFNILLVGNKSDLEGQRQVTYEEGAALAKEWNCAFWECSAKKKENIAKVFSGIMELILTQEDGPGSGKGKFGIFNKK